MRKKIKKQVFRRDNYTCQCCGRTVRDTKSDGNLEANEAIASRIREGGNKPKNFTTTCYTCNQLMHLPINDHNDMAKSMIRQLLTLHMSYCKIQRKYLVVNLSQHKSLIVGMDLCAKDAAYQAVIEGNDLIAVFGQKKTILYKTKSTTKEPLEIGAYNDIDSGSHRTFLTRNKSISEKPSVRPSLTQHCMDRYFQRVLWLDEATAKREKITLNRLAEKHLQLLYEDSSFIYQGKTGHQKYKRAKRRTVNVYLYEDLLIIMNRTGRHVLTIYRIDPTDNKNILYRIFDKPSYDVRDVKKTCKVNQRRITSAITAGLLEKTEERIVTKESLVNWLVVGKPSIAAAAV